VALVWFVAAGPFRFGIGPYGEAGIGWVNGEAYASDTVSREDTSWVLLLGATGSLRARPAPGWWLVLDLQGGFTLNGVRALSEGRAVAGVDGPALSVSLGIAAEM